MAAGRVAAPRRGNKDGARDFQTNLIYACAGDKGGQSMRMMLKITMPTEPGNRGIKDGSLSKLLEATLAKLKPEAAYFCPYNGERTALIFFDLAEVADIPAIVEPLFLGVDADVEVIPVMTIDDLRKGLAAM